jgi:hypothetical protein
MLTEGKISIEEAEVLLDAFGDTGDTRGEAQTGERNCCGAFFGDSDFDFNDFDKNFGSIFGGSFGDIFSHFGDIFGGSTKQKSRQSTCR